MSGEARDIQAELTLLAEAPFRGSLNGIRPSFNFGGELTACEVRASPSVTQDHTGVPLPVSIHLYYTTPAHDALEVGPRFQLNAASHMFAEGVIVALE